ncbi:Unknown protein [Striga hermonthica]|uniref:KIB1-4 beta-propeller domain-containing protein n=1 Tax=Striga hermonthica TaxID=68872 RepID=A0A9N7NMG8_STRHE|nr:Unknown protein [Striga hermonthica]
MLIWLHLTQQKYIPIGSSHGRLAFSGDENNPDDPFLFCPFSGTRIRLPATQTIPRIHYPQFLPKLDKIVLCGNPSHDPNFTALAIHGAGVAFCRPGTDEIWSHLDTDIRTVYDVVCCDATKTAFVLGPGPAIEAWDVGGAVPCKKSEILGDFCPEAVARAGERYPRDLYTTRWYLGRPEHGSEPGQLYIVVRYVGEFVRHDGEVVHEGDTLTDDAAEPLVCPYKTVGFEVFKYSDCDGRKWVVAGGLEGRAMFLGGNQTVMVEGEKGSLMMKDAIYFTDDYRERLDEDYCYGGHDNGVYVMEDGSVKQIGEGLEPKILPPPSWISAPSASSFSLFS